MSIKPYYENQFGKLFYGNCIEILLHFDSVADLVLCDPPYGTTACAWDTPIPLLDMWVGIYKAIKDNKAIVLMANEPFTSKLICSNISSFKYRWDWIKNKPTNFLNAKRQPLRCVEDVCVFYDKLDTYNAQKTDGHKPVNSFTKHTGDGASVGKTRVGFAGGGQTDRYPVNVIKIPVVNNDGLGQDGPKLMSTQKPVALMEYFIKTYTHANEIVLDFASGTGTTGLACINTGRKFILIEKDEKQCEIAAKRLSAHIN